MGKVYVSIVVSEFDKYKKYGAYHWEAIDNSFRNRFRKYSLPLMLRYDKILSCFEGENRKVLEIGCGDGVLVHLTAQKGHQITGFDLDETGIRLAKEKTSNLSYKFTPKFYKEDFLKHDFKDCQYDYIVLADVIEHLTDPGSIIEKTISILKKDGCVLLTTPAKMKNHQWDKHHVKEYTVAELDEFLKRFSNQVTIEQFMPLKIYRIFQRFRIVFNLIDYAINPLKINSPLSSNCMIFAALRK